MRARYVVSFSLAVAALSPALAEESAPPGYRLDELKEIARSAHPTLDATEAAVEASMGWLRQAKAYPNPVIAVGFGRGRPRDGGDSRSESRVEFVQPIELSGIRRWRARVAELQLRGAEMDLTVAQTIVDSTVAQLAYTVLLEERRVEIARRSANVAAHLQELLARRVEVGESSPLEAVRARSEWFARRRELLDAESALAATRAALDLFCGDRLTEGYAIAETLEDRGVSELPDDLRDRLRTDNPVLRRAAIVMEETEARTEVARKEVVPRLDLFAGYDTELDRTAASVGAGLIIPLWDRNRGAIAAATAGQVEAAATLRGLVLELQSSLEQASSSYQSAVAAVLLHQEGWTGAARQALDIATFSFENGEASLLDVLDAQRSDLAVSLAEAESWAGLAIARAEIERLIAGPLKAEDDHETR